MKLLLTLAVSLCAIALGASNTPETFRVQIEERGTLVNEEVEVKGDVHIYRVPAHNDILASTVVLDYSKGLKVWYEPAKEKCFATTLRDAKPDPGQQKTVLRKFSDPNLMVHASMGHLSSIGYIRSPKPLEDRSFLPIDAQYMCKGVPVFWSTAVDITNRTEGSFLIKANPEDIPTETRRMKRASVKCLASDFYQNCDINSGRSCFYVISCPTLLPSGECLLHVRNSELTCRVCCDTAGYTKDPNVRLKHCDLYGGKQGSG